MTTEMSAASTSTDVVMGSCVTDHSSKNQDVAGVEDFLYEHALRRICVELGENDPALEEKVEQVQREVDPEWRMLEPLPHPRTSSARSSISEKHWSFNDLLYPREDGIVRIRWAPAANSTSTTGDSSGLREVLSKMLLTPAGQAQAADVEHDEDHEFRRAFLAKVAQRVFDSVLGACRVLSRNVIDAYFDACRDERRALFLAQKAIAEAADRSWKLEELSQNKKIVAGATVGLELTPANYSSKSSLAAFESSQKTTTMCLAEDSPASTKAASSASNTAASSPGEESKTTAKKYGAGTTEVSPGLSSPAPAVPIGERAFWTVLQATCAKTIQSFCFPLPSDDSGDEEGENIPCYKGLQLAPPRALAEEAASFQGRGGGPAPGGSGSREEDGTVVTDEKLRANASVSVCATRGHPSSSCTSSKTSLEQVRTSKTAGNGKVTSSPTPSLVQHGTKFSEIVARVSRGSSSSSEESMSPVHRDERGTPGGAPAAQQHGSGSAEDDDQNTKSNNSKSKEQSASFYVHPFLRLGTTPGSGSGLYTTQDIPEGDLVRVPADFLINAARACQDARFAGFLANYLRLVNKKDDGDDAVADHEKEPASEPSPAGARSGTCSAAAGAMEDEDEEEEDNSNNSTNYSNEDVDEDFLLLVYLVFLKKVDGLPASFVVQQRNRMFDADSGKWAPADQNRLEMNMRAAMKLLPPRLEDLPATLLTWPEEALENLYSTQVVYQVEKSRAQCVETLKQLKTEIFVAKSFSAGENGQSREMHQNSAEATEDIFADLDLDDVLWARTLIDSRAFNLRCIVESTSATTDSSACSGESSAARDRISSEEVRSSSNEVEDKNERLKKDACAAEEAKALLLEQVAAVKAVERKKGRADQKDGDDVAMENEDENEDEEEESDADGDEDDTEDSPPIKGQTVNGIFLPTQNLTCIAPVADYLNHSRKSPLLMPKIDENGCFVLSSACTIPVRGTIGGATSEAPLVPSAKSEEAVQCTEVCLNYGALQNYELLLFYGFCFDINSSDTLQLDIGEPPEEHADYLQELRLGTNHVLAHVEEKVDDKASTGAPSSSSSSGSSKAAPSWPLSAALLATLRVLHGITIDDEDLSEDECEGGVGAPTSTSKLDKQRRRIRDPRFDSAAAHCGADLQVAETVLDVLQELLVPSDTELKTSVMTATSVLWEDHPTYGSLARKFRESQRALVRGNIEALEKYKTAIVASTVAARIKSRRAKTISSEDDAEAAGAKKKMGAGANAGSGDAGGKKKQKRRKRG